VDPNLLLISPEACHAHLLRGVIEATGSADEPRADAYTRSGMIIEMFKCLAPNDALQATIACHCIMLRFVLMAAMRDAADSSLDPKMLARARSSAMTISRQWDVWSTKFDKMKARDEAETLAGEQPGKTAPAGTRKPASTAPRSPAEPSGSMQTPSEAPTVSVVRQPAQEPGKPTNLEPPAGAIPGATPGASSGAIQKPFRDRIEAPVEPMSPSRGEARAPALSPAHLSAMRPCPDATIHGTTCAPLAITETGIGTPTRPQTG
jgi:hypothetical protein